MQTHATGGQDAKKKLLALVDADIDLLRRSLSPADFASRWPVVESKWNEAKVDEATRWVDKRGNVRDFVQYFHEQWVSSAGEWHVGCSREEVVLSTNNGAEPCVKTHAWMPATSSVQSLRRCPSFSRRCRMSP